MNKKAIAILGAIFILIVGTLGFLIYAKYSGSKTPATPPVTNNNASTTPPVVTQNTASTTPPSSNIVQLTSDQVVSPALFFNGTGISYFDHQGNLYQASLQNNNGQLTLTGKKQLDIPQKPGITKILWPAKGNDFIAQLTDSTGKTTWSYFNSNTSSYTNLSSQVESVDWMPAGDKIMYVWLDNGKASLSLGNPDTSGHKTLAVMWEIDDQLHVSPDGSQALYFETQNTSANNLINSVTADGKLFKGLVKNGQNFGVLWSPDGQKFLFGKKDPVTQNYQLWVDNLTSGAVMNLGLFTTMDKAVWSSDSNVIYAAVPSTGMAVPEGLNTAGSAAGGQLTADSFYRLNTTTLDKKQYQSSGAAIDGRDMFLNSTGDKLFFRNAQDGGLYYLDLTQ
jgi:hypothetical protein